MADMAGARLQFREAGIAAGHIAEIPLANALMKIAAGLEQMTLGLKDAARLQFHEAGTGFAAGGIKEIPTANALMKIAAGLELML